MLLWTYVNLFVIEWLVMLGVLLLCCMAVVS